LPENPQQFEGQEANLQHARAMALDIQIPDLDNEAVARDFASFIYGGVGIYPHHDFFHVDFGPNRQWVGPSPPPIRSRTWSASGFIVNLDGYLVTNAHVAKDCPSMTMTHDGREISIKHILAMDPETDLALLSTDEPWGTVPVLSGNPAQIGDSVFALGFPLRGVLSSEPIITMGIVNAMAGMRGDATEFQMSAQVQPGNSGGPVLDESGKIVGVVVARLSSRAGGDVPQNVNFAVSLGSLRAFLNTHRVEFAESVGQFPRKPRDIATSARQYTVAIDCWK
jgi:S1-C subfamily serine protease